MIRALVAALATLLIAGEAGAQEFVRHDCRTTVQATSKLQFENDLHARWYKRFWTGSCQDLSLCMAGSPNWNDIVGKLLSKGGPSEQPVLLPKACRLGQLIGMEWSRDRRIKRIKTGDLKVFNTMLEASGDPLRGVDQVERKARTLITPR
jgi:hypothetical protein